ncbi:cleavage and polyadenylation specificity factor subunit 2-like [Tigriopus californicus]|uniref:cleavage and polyadenylation specificity factor subunit 2-like n=1 Tax=Tigriopus californicus TaxID=6832 RepID=UPI0027DA56A4|nr:cleavage and polyadenylation specificity factor subunit 2-like [Tigriopus californicus]|eukprot:TCALIF_03247-PA protein Name:"Similar to Cpsf100 Probable cleavage and polyadenylation specificity factor subunit 2 (Drosophila melanogaster)" AED:0.08 eAED:0.08 QI:59/1/1/1/1/1/3/74/761
MTSIIKFRPLSGGMMPAQSALSPPHAYLLELDQFTFLCDCGWNAQFDMAFMHELKAVVHKIDAVLLSYPDMSHLGGLPYAVSQLGLSCPIYATVPIYKMGQMFMYDLYQARFNMEDFQLFSLDEVDKTFEMITQLKYNQTVQLRGKGEGIAITPMPAGHMIGGSLWKIVKEGEEDIIYAVDFNHKKEQHLNGSEIEKIQRPSLLITDAFNASYKQVRRRDRDEKLMTSILQTLRNKGNVLVCVDTAGRVLELAHMIDHLWQIQDSGLIAYSLALLNNMSFNVIEFAKSQIEWMSDKLMRNFEGRRNNPFQFKHLKLCHSIAEVNKVPSPKVVLASMPDLECGFSRDLFLSWCGKPQNNIIITSRTGEGTLAHDLVANGTNRTINLEIKKRVKLSGAELEEHKRVEREKAAAVAKAKKQNNELLIDDESSDEEMDTGGPVKHDIIMKVDAAKENNQSTTFFKTVKAKHMMFPLTEEKVKWDDYGEIIRPEDWMDTVIDPDPIKNPATNGRTNSFEYEDTKDIVEIPTKCISSVQRVQLKAQIHFIDFEGRSDGESIVKVLQQVKPRRLILVRGREDQCLALANQCRQLWAKAQESSGQTQQKVNIYTPKNGETVDATTESYIYQVRLPESLVSRLSFSKGKDGLLAWVDGKISFNQEEIADVQSEDAEEVKKKPAIPTLVPLCEGDISGHPSVFVNELKLSDFKIVLTKSGISSEFAGGVLFCGNGNVALRRHDSGRVTIEGTVCDEYYRVRELLYDQYAIV